MGKYPFCKCSDGVWLFTCAVAPSHHSGTRSISVNEKNIDLYKLAKDNGTTYRMVRTLNPWLLSDHLTNKTGKKYTLQLPVERGTLYKTLTQDRHNTNPVTRL